MKHISTTAFKEVIEAEANNSTIDFINVCTSIEYKEKHIKGVRSVPLAEITKHIDEFNGKQTIYVHCRSGARSARAIDELMAAGVTAELVNVEGGLLSWGEAGYITHSIGDKKRIPIIRQVLIAAGSVILLVFIAAHLVHEGFRFIVLLVALGLIFSGVTGKCGMAQVLSKMPWNR